MQSLACLGFFSATMQFFLIVYPKSSILFEGGNFFIFLIIISLSYGLIKAWPRPIEQEYSQPKTIVKIIKGDILKQQSHIVIGMCDTFDTETPSVISNNSLQGQVLHKLFNGDLTQFDKLVNESLNGKKPISTIEKKGKKLKYGIGSTAIITHSPRLLYLLAYCEMNEFNEAKGTVDGVWRSLIALWEQISRTANGSPVAIPVLGGGQARMSNILPAQDSIRLIILSYIFASRDHKICDELRIVVQDKEYDKLDRMQLQSFLSSLRGS
ncbi:macro domain-containing protein [Acerihabitans arboris]|uniref:Thoeris protein ThsA Macro domain-containing protein n=1 Tax=Acerihabitans arboris TaxID=2691583 RepID=A0A845SP21_9GAMM|nr:macro domain-containing protein [Acerihabitans arboris]NDL64258.1 hypothetical protein [Acerihabitans arboris]